MSDETLKSCPFCGGEAKLIKADRPSYTPHSEGWYVMCKCDASLGFHGNDNEYNTYGDFPHELCAIQAWNTRHVETCEFKPFRGPISDTDEEGDRKGICSECSAYMHEQFNYCQNCGRKVVGA